MGPKDQRPIWVQVVEYVANHPNGVGRSDVAQAFHITKTTAISHLEKGVDRDYLVKVYTWVKGNRRGYVYYARIEQSAGDPDSDYIRRMGANESPLDVLLRG